MASDRRGDRAAARNLQPTVLGYVRSRRQHGDGLRHDGAALALRRAANRLASSHAQRAGRRRCDAWPRRTARTWKSITSVACPYTAGLVVSEPAPGRAARPPFVTA